MVTIILSMVIVALVAALVFGVPYLLKQVTRAITEATTAASASVTQAATVLIAPPSVPAGAQTPGQQMPVWEQNDPVLPDYKDWSDEYMPDPAYMRPEAAVAVGENPFGIEGLTLDFNGVPDRQRY